MKKLWENKVSRTQFVAQYRKERQRAFCEDEPGQDSTKGFKISSSQRKKLSKFSETMEGFRLVLSAGLKRLNAEEDDNYNGKK